MNDCDGRHLTHAVFYIVTHLLSFTVDGRRKDDEGIPSPPILYCRYPSSSSSPCNNRLDISSIYKYFRQVDISIRPERSSSVYHSTHTFRMVLHRSTPKQPAKVKQHAQRCADIGVLSDPCQMDSVAIAWWRQRRSRPLYIQSFQPLNFCLKLSIENMFSSFRQAKRKIEERNPTSVGRLAISRSFCGVVTWARKFNLALSFYFIFILLFFTRRVLRHNQKCGRIFWPCPFPISKPSAV